MFILPCGPPHVPKRIHSYYRIWLIAPRKYSSVIFCGHNEGLEWAGSVPLNEDCFLVFSKSFVKWNIFWSDRIWLHGEWIGLQMVKSSTSGWCTREKLWKHLCWLPRQIRISLLSRIFFDLLKEKFFDPRHVSLSEHELEVGLILMPITRLWVCCLVLCLTHKNSWKNLYGYVRGKEEFCCWVLISLIRYNKNCSILVMCLCLITFWL